MDSVCPKKYGGAHWRQLGNDIELSTCAAVQPVVKLLWPQRLLLGTSYSQQHDHIKTQNIAFPWHLCIFRGHHLSGKLEMMGNLIAVKETSGPKSGKCLASVRKNFGQGRLFTVLFMFGSKPVSCRLTAVLVSPVFKDFYCLLNHREHFSTICTQHSIVVALESV